MTPQDLSDRGFVRGSIVTTWRGCRWESFGIHRDRPLPGGSGLVLMAFTPAAPDALPRENSPWRQLRTRVLERVPTWLATPSLHELRALAGEVDFEGYRANTADCRPWLIGGATFDAGLLACGLAVLPNDVGAVSVSMVGAPSRLSTEITRLLVVETPSLWFIVPPLVGDPPVRLLETRTGLELRPMRARAS